MFNMKSAAALIWLFRFGRVDAWTAANAPQATRLQLKLLESQAVFNGNTFATIGRQKLKFQLSASDMDDEELLAYLNEDPLPPPSQPPISPDDMDPEELLEYLNNDDGLASSFQEFQKEKLLLHYIKGCPLFTDVSESDCSRLASRMVEMTVEPGKVLIEKGATDKAGMYFVKEGTFDCLGENNTLLTTYEEAGAYFGELSLVFSGQPRAATIVATGTRPAKVYRLDKKTFQESLRESPDTAVIFDTARQILLKKYSSTRLRDVLPKVRFDEIIGLFQAKLLMGSNQRTYKKLFTFTMGASLTVLTSFWKPQMNGGWLQLCDMSTDAARVLPLQLVSGLLATTSIFGVLAQSSSSGADAKSDQEATNDSDKLSEPSRSRFPKLKGIANKVASLVTVGLWAAGPDPRRILLQTLICIMVKQVNFVGSKQQHDKLIPVVTSLLLAYEATRIFLRPVLL